MFKPNPKTPSLPIPEITRSACGRHIGEGARPAPGAACVAGPSINPTAARSTASLNAPVRQPVSPKSSTSPEPPHPLNYNHGPNPTHRSKTRNINYSPKQG